MYTNCIQCIAKIVNPVIIYANLRFFFLSDYEKISSIDIDKNTLNNVLDAIFPKDDFSMGIGEGGFFCSPFSSDDEFPFGRGDD